MVLPYQVWMAQRVAATLERCAALPDGGGDGVRELLEGLGAAELMELPAMLSGCPLHKVGGLIFPGAAPTPAGAPALLAAPPSASEALPDHPTARL